MELILTAGAMGSSFDAEVQAAQMAFRNVPSSGLGPATTIRWFTDSLSCIQALQSPLQAQQDSIRILWNIMETILSRGHHIQAVWIPSHCGIDGNEAADKLANKAAIQNSLVAQQTVPLSLQAAISIHKQRTAHQLIEIPELPPDLNHIPRRRAEVILHQLVCSSFSGVRAFYPPRITIQHVTFALCQYRKRWNTHFSDALGEAHQDENCSDSCSGSKGISPLYAEITRLIL